MSTVSQRAVAAKRPAKSLSPAPARRCVAAAAPPPPPPSRPRLELTPPTAEFINYDVDTTYVMPLEVRNRTEEIQTLRFVNPTRHPGIFRLVHGASARVAPGLAHTVEIEFTTHAPLDYEDTLVILSSDGGRVEVPLRACRVPLIEYPPAVHFGRVEQQLVCPTRTLTLVNRGRTDAAVTFVLDERDEKDGGVACGVACGVVLSSTMLTVPAESRTNVMMELKPLPPGLHTWRIPVDMNGQRLPTLLEVSAEVVDCRSRLLDPQTHDEVVSVEFPETFAGNSASHALEVVNGGSQAISFAIRSAHDASEGGATPFRFVPSQGRLPPQGRLAVSALFTPQLKVRRTGWSTTPANAPAETAEVHKYEALFSLLFVETEQTQSFRMVGTSSETLVRLSTSVVDFGACVLKSSREATLTLTNGVAHLPMRYALTCPPHFSVTPVRGIVDAGGCATLHVVFRPRRLGSYAETLTLTANDTVTRAVELRGTSLYREGAHVAAAVSARTAGAAGDEVAVAAAVDMGMIPAEGLTPPSLPRQVPAAVLKAEDTAVQSCRSGHVAPPVFDVHSLARRRFHAVPTTPQERRDCKRELTPMEVLSVVLPSKSLDFGRVTIHADAVASLFVYNGTKSCIHVGVPTEADGPVSVDPASQVVPAQRMAHFDVHLRSGAVQAFQQVMRVAVNQQHHMRFSVQADVVPVEVTLSQTHVLLSLTGQAEEPVCAAQVTLINKGNCAAAYRWHLPTPSCEFEVEPQMGLLSAGEQRGATFFFRPAAGTSQASCAARLEVVGATEDKLLQLTGSVAPTKCSWGASALLSTPPLAPSAKEAAPISGVLALGRIAAGVPAVATLPLANKGRTNAYFSVGALPAWLTVSPSQGRVCAGETEELTVRVRQSMAGSVVHVVECSVAGMRRPLAARVEATVVAPPLSVELDGKAQGEAHLDFGRVYVGCPQSRSVALRNAGDVAAAVRVNLEACTSYSLESAVLEEEWQPDVAGSVTSLGAPEDTRHSRLMSRVRSLHSLTLFDRKTSAGVSAATVVVPPLAEYTLRLSFNPLRAAAAQCCSVRWHQLGADDVHPLPPFTVAATALTPPVVLSTTSISFPGVVVGQRPPPRVIYVRRGDARLSPSSPLRRPVAWQLEMETDANTPCFLAEPHRGVLGVGEEQAVTITYLPSTAGRLQTCVSLKTEEEAASPAGAPCARCIINASATDPRVRSDRTTLTFPSVPLGVAVATTVMLHNEGYDAVRVDYPGACDPPLQIAFPEGQAMGAAPRAAIPVTFTFCSPTPISVRSSIRLHTDAGGHIDISVSGSAVNSILTTEAFVAYMGHTSATTITGGAGGDSDDSPYVLQRWAGDRDSVVGVELPLVCSLPASLGGAHERPRDMVDAVEGGVDWEAERAWLTAWWNAVVCRAPVQDLVEALQATRGGLVGDLTYQLTGKRPRRSDAMEPTSTASTRAERDVDAAAATVAAAAASTSTSTVRGRKATTVRGGSQRPRAPPDAVGGTSAPASSSAVPKELRALHTLVQHIRACGGCLSDVELPYLLPFDAFAEHMSAQAPAVLEQLAGVADGEEMEEMFLRRAVASWVVLLRECLRLFYVSQVRWTAATVTPPALRAWAASLPAHRSLSRSNIYSEEESLLLRWTAACVASFAVGDTADLQKSLSPVAPRCFEDLQDAPALIAVVLTYVPDLARRVREALAPAASHSRESLASIVLGLLHTLGVPGLPTADAFVVLPPTQFVLLLTHLFLYLPKFVHAVPVHFHGRALTTLTETVTVENTSAEPREYCVLLPDAPQFRAQTDKLVVAPRSSSTLTLSIIPRTRRPETGRCLLVDCSAQVPPAERLPFVFGLEAAPTMEPLQTVYVETPQYECLQSELHITNPFAVDCVVSLRVAQMRLPGPAEAAWCDGSTASLWRSGHDAPFTIATDVLSLRRGEPTRLPFSFAPLSRGVYRLLLTFWEEREGEFTWAVEATSGWPKPTEANLELRVELGESCTSTLHVKSSNVSLERCVKLYEDRAHNPQRTDLVRMLSGAPYTVYFVNERMEGPNPFFTAEQNPCLAAAAPATTWPMTFTFRPQCVGVYRTYAVLMSEADVRLLLIVGECVPRGDRRELLFACPARQTISQQITLCNHSADEDWLFTATLEGSAQFSGPHDVRVLSGRSKEYTIRYAPAWISGEERETATLVLVNSATGQKHTYALVGTAEPPLSEGILTLDCRARDHESLEMVVPNICSQDTTYFVKTDLACCEGESPSLVIPRASSRRFAMKVHPTVGGDYSGRVTFTASNGRYVWYAVQLHVAPPEKEGVVELRTNVRTSMVADVSVTNPLDAALLFKVHRYGSGLYGANTFQLAPRAAATYSLLFVPTQAGESTGRLSLVSEAAGEFWYELHMTVTEAEPEPLPFPPTPIGQVQVMQVHLPNRSSASAVLAVDSTDAACFGVRPARVVLPAQSESVVDLVFTPRCVGVEQKAVVTLRNPELGCWRYACVGTGTAPSKAEPLTCTCGVGTTTTLMLPFTNVLKRDTAVEVQLSGDTTAFALRTVPSGVVAAGASVSLVVAFTPSLVRRHNAVVEVRPAVRRSDKTCDVAWTYPIEGYCVYRQTQPSLRLRCAARTQCADTVYVHAPGLLPGVSAAVSVAFEVDPQQSYAAAAAASASCSATMPSPYPDGFELNLKFAPLRPLVGAGWVVLRGAEGGVWQYRVQLESSPAPVDDTIVLYGEYKERTSASFDLYNVFPYRSAFFAYFTADSSKDFAVAPAHGVLLPFVPGQRGAATATNLQITVHPSSRIPQVEGTLVVDTDDMQWTFRVLAKFGHQNRPTS
ncbi:Flagellar-associated PapD-like [Novymonas esmeraldas]|uniref:Flagellar-associated PapD-like n=1 Tax=Novymonas esmeraldas TaxID=1808958 RepID=A0AAW0EMF3_9TRYP